MQFTVPQMQTKPLIRGYGATDAHDVTKEADVELNHLGLLRTEEVTG
jgi:hypothetical protein